MNFLKRNKLSIAILMLSILFMLLLPVLAGVDTGVPAIINGWKTFTSGIYVGDANTIVLNSNGNITAKHFYQNTSDVSTLDPNGKVPEINTYLQDLSGYVPYDANSMVSNSLVYDKHTNLDANSLTLSNASIDPNGLGTFANLKIGTATVATLDPNSKISIANSYDQHTNLTSSSLTLSTWTIQSGSATLTSDPNGTNTDPNSYIIIPTIAGIGNLAVTAVDPNTLSDPNTMISGQFDIFNGGTALYWKKFGAIDDILTAAPTGKIIVGKDPNSTGYKIHNRTSVIRSVKYKIEN